MLHVRVLPERHKFLKSICGGDKRYPSLAKAVSRALRLLEEEIKAEAEKVNEQKLTEL